MNELKLVVSGLFLIIVSPIVIHRSYSTPAEFSSLIRVAGHIESIDLVTTKSQYNTISWNVIRLRGHSTAFKYLNWFPQASNIKNLIQPGQEITIWVDANDVWVWQIERRGSVVIPYSSVSSTVKDNIKGDWGLGWAILFAGIALLVWGIRNMNRDKRKRPLNMADALLM